MEEGYPQQYQNCIQFNPRPAVDNQKFTIVEISTVSGFLPCDKKITILLYKMQNNALHIHYYIVIYKGLRCAAQTV